MKNPSFFSSVAQWCIGLWLRVPQLWRDEIVSGLHTFIGAFVFQFAFQVHTMLVTGQLPTSRDALVAVGVAITRSATKNAWIAFQGWASAQWQAYKASKSTDASAS